MKNEIQAIAFDIDGTLYSSASFYFRIAPYFLKHMRFFITYNKARKILHRTAPLADFYEYQSRLLEEIKPAFKGCGKQKIQEIVYDGLKPYFKKQKPYKYTMEVFQECKKRGIKIGILSDFPPEQKGEMWGLKEYCDVVMGSESLGALKPSIYVFGQLQMALGVPSKNILYVGNSVKADMDGAKNAGMQTAYIQTWFGRIFNKKPANADICFKNYRQFMKTVLN